MKNPKNWKGLLYGIAYGLLSRLVFGLEGDYLQSYLYAGELMTFSFLFLVPFVIGLIVAYYHDTVTRSGKILGIIMSLFSILGFVGISVIVGWEGFICALMALPIFAIMASLGGFIGINLFKRNRSKVLVSALLVLPLLVAPIESQFKLSEKIFSENTSIVINATDEVVWQNLTRVRPITESENKRSLFQFMGFPRPLEAELDTVAVGGVRKAIFDRGLFFTETVTQMLPLQVLAFSIEADPESIPPAALDEHVMVGGKYFDVLEGKYEIEKLNNGKILLHLSSQFRLSTRFNFYSGFWSKLIMRDIQENILEIIKERCEQT
ncbi:hypothetical protein GBK04_11630 [Cytophagaceae bacterium SJW1-29]|uniref:SRPBCC family protein n=2 Tax=Salmonirosea aquatica TaxID=2654236 RepID=A0A7C9BEU7_9BACT|nr:hypothetical protein [Cytophagaceae bacterium SJW1-29]